MANLAHWIASSSSGARRLPSALTLARLGGFLDEILPQVLYGLGVVGGTLAGGAADPDGRIKVPLTSATFERVPLAWVSVALFLLGALLVGLRSRKLRQLARDQEGTQNTLAAVQKWATAAEQAARDLSQTELQLLSQELHHFTNERVSLMVPTADGGFMLVARWSADPTLREHTRNIYFKGQGCIGRAWQRGNEIVSELPDPAADLEAWIEAQKRWEIPDDIARSMTMKSRTYAAFRIDSQQPGVGFLGVIVFESKDLAGSTSAKFSLAELSGAMKGAQAKRIASLLFQLPRFLSDPAA